MDKPIYVWNVSDSSGMEPVMIVTENRTLREVEIVCERHGIFGITKVEYVGEAFQ